MQVKASKQWAKTDKARTARVDADLTAARYYVRTSPDQKLSECKSEICLHLSQYGLGSRQPMFKVEMTPSQAKLLGERLVEYAAKDGIK